MVPLIVRIILILTAVIDVGFYLKREYYRNLRYKESGGSQEVFVRLANERIERDKGNFKFSSCLEALHAGVSTFLLYPIFIIWALSHDIGITIFAFVALISYLSGWIRFGWTVYPLIKAFGSAMKDDIPLFKIQDKLTSQISDNFPVAETYSWRELFSRTYFSIPMFFLVYLAIITRQIS